MQKLPIGTQAFSILRENNLLYVDKTRHIFNMIDNGRVYFLSRPRRFGKSLLVSTLDELFKGNKDLFKGLFIYDKWNWEIKYPVLKLDFGARSYDTDEDLKKSLTYFVNSRAEQFNITLEAPMLSDRVEELFIKLNDKTGQKVVVLIDEYDKAITDFLSEPAKANANRKQLHNFYQVLKAADKHIQFIFLTGISKFSGVSVFSALNNPRDITRSKDFAAICGYTQSELETNFADYIDTTAKELDQSKNELLDDIRYWYNGYTWDGKTRVYNPFSTLSFFKHREFANYWIKTGTSISAKILLK
ncbi:MAG: AAA family ATPase, partial [Elusimicrobiota bacterium]|nr:AAA family ATPase [Elusimicrobiota bacterium]